MRLEDLNGPRGGVDTRCRIIVDTRTGGPIAAEAVDVDLVPAVDRAVDRAARSLARTPARRCFWASGAGRPSRVLAHPARPPS